MLQFIWLEAINASKYILLEDCQQRFWVAYAGGLLCGALLSWAWRQFSK